MKRIVIVLTCTLLAVAFAPDANAQKKKAAPPPEPVEEVEQSCPEIVQENTLEGCRDGLDNDTDGHVDCDDQDCEIYAMCLSAPTAKPAPVKPVPTFANMRELKQARHDRQITAEEYHQAWSALRQARAAELEELRCAYEAGQLSKYDYRDARREIVTRYEG